VFISQSSHNSFSQIFTSSIFFFDQSAIVTFVHATKHEEVQQLLPIQSCFQQLLGLVSSSVTVVALLYFGT
jgi:hypothetical protein